MRGCRFLILVLFILIKREPLTAQNFSYIGIEQGLSNNTVTTIYKDKLGFMWFGTIDGLNRFDGYTFKVFRNKFNEPKSLPNDIINCINADNVGNIWVGTQKGIGMLDIKTMEFSKIYYKDSLNKSQVFDKWIYVIKTDGRGDMYIGSANLGLSVFSAASKEISRIPLIDNQGKRHYNYTVNAIAVLNGSEILLAAEHVGLCVYNTKSNAVNILTDRLPIANVVRIDHRNGKAWIGTRSGLFVYNLQSHVVQKYTLGNKASDDSWITDLMIDKAGCIWLTTDGQGIIKIKGNDFNSYTVIKQENPGSLSSNAVYTIFEDELSKIWIGTLRGGIDMIDAKKNQFKAYAHDSYAENSLVNNFTFSFCEDKDKSVWVGTDGGGLSIWDRASNSFRNNPYKISDGAQISNFHVASIIKDAQQRIWFAAFANGIYRFNPNNKQFERILMESNHALNAVWKLYCGQNQDVWATCLPGLSTSDHDF
jgi:ligand-binding sensor domain-containing protein